MNELLTFQSADGRFKFTVKGEFITRCPEPSKCETFDLMTKFKLNQYLHNPTGPAIHRLKDNMLEYWIDGQLVSKEVGEKMAHDYQFGNKVLSTVTE